MLTTEQSTHGGSGIVRRSGRQRVPNSRLPDDHFLFSSRRQRSKSEHIEVVPRKRKLNADDTKEEMCVEVAQQAADSSESSGRQQEVEGSSKKNVNENRSKDSTTRAVEEVGASPAGNRSGPGEPDVQGANTASEEAKPKIHPEETGESLHDDFVSRKGGGTESVVEKAKESCEVTDPEAVFEAQNQQFQVGTKEVKIVTMTLSDSGELVEMGEKTAESEQLVESVVVAGDANPATSKSTAVHLETVNLSQAEAQSEDEANTSSKLVMHLTDGNIVELSGEKLSLDLVKLLEKGSAQLAEVQSLPEGYVCFALEDSSTEEEQQPPVSQQNGGAALRNMSVPPVKDGNKIIPRISSQGVLECPHCPYSTDKKANWYKHKKKHSGQRRYQCEHCPYKAATSSNLKRHYAVHLDIRQFQCSACNQTFRQKIHLERHVRYRHEMKQIKCSLCNYQCSNYNPDLKQHMRRVHQMDGDPGNLDLLTCKQCGYIGSKKRDLRQHMKFHKPGPEVKLFCEHCSFITDCESRLTRHMLTHTNEKPFACGLCNYKGTQKEHVIRHMVTVHKVQPERTGKPRKPPSGFTFPTEERKDTSGEQPVPKEPRSEDTPHGSQEAGGSTEKEIEERTNENEELPVHPGNDNFTEISIKVMVRQNTDASNKLKEVAANESGSTLEELKERKETEDASKSLEFEYTPASAQANPESVATVREAPQSTVDQQKEMSIFAKKVRLPATYTNPSREKLFACMHCTMKFAKAINLYKHLKIQHREVQPVEDGSYGCVLCEYKTNKRKNLLVHLRKHNAWPNEAPEYYYPPSARVYSCIMCDYKDPVKKNMEEHWETHHKSQDQNYVSVVGVGDDAQQHVKGFVALTPPQAQVPGESFAVVRSALSSSTATEHSPDGNVESNSGQKTVMVMMEPGMPPTPVQINAPGLNSPSFSGTSEVVQTTTLTEAMDTSPATETTAELTELIPGNVENGRKSDSVSEEVSEATEDEVHLTQEQLSKLEAGDFIEINGETYKVEFQSQSS